ncbi:SPOR domain-containing protein [Halomonas sp. HNIBRBA4712]|uniref:SPOR domain-containing protein n=1 Tax=Halomonas sp. HNIBRBA4712 TaxID=3373087 RepID=UPI00374727FB
MKYGKTERISGLVILLALLAIFVPWLMSDPAPREERPQPTFVIEQPASVPRQEVPVPQMPSSINALPRGEVTQSGANQPGVESVEAEPQSPQTGQVESSAPEPDPIAELVASNDTASSAPSNGSSSNASPSSSGPATAAQGEWAVQVGSFGDVSNAERLSEQLSSQGFSAFRRARDNNLTSVYVGPYATSEEGESAMAVIKQRANVQGLLVRVRD